MLLAKKPEEKSARIEFRVSKKFKSRFVKELQKSRLNESEVGRVALVEFFANHSTPEEQALAVIRSRSATD